MIKLADGIAFYFIVSLTFIGFSVFTNAISYKIGNFTFLKLNFMNTISFKNFFYLFVCAIVLTTVNFGQTSNQNKLTIDKIVDKTIKAGESQDYFVKLKEKNFIQIQLDQKGIDAILTLYSPQGRELIKRDSPNGETGAEIISYIAQTNGNYKVTVSVLAESETKNGNISIKIVTQRPPNSIDNSRIEAESLFQAAQDSVGTDSELSKKNMLKAQ